MTSYAGKGAIVSLHDSMLVRSRAET